MSLEKQPPRNMACDGRERKPPRIKTATAASGPTPRVQIATGTRREGMAGLPAPRDVAQGVRKGMSIATMGGAKIDATKSFAFLSKRTPGATLKVDRSDVSMRPSTIVLRKTGEQVFKPVAMEPLPPIQRKLFSSNGGPTTTAKLSLLFRRDEGKSNEAKKVSAHNTPQSRNKPLALDVSKQNKETKSSSNLPQEKTDQVQHRSRSHTTAIITPPGMSSTAPKLQLRKRRQEEASVTGAQGTQKKQTVAVSDAADKEVVVRAATPNIVSPNPRRCSVSLNSKPHTMSNAESSPFDANQCGDRISILPHSIEYVTAEEKELAMIRHEALDLTDEFQSDLVKIEDVIADSFATHRRAAQKVLDANVILSECLLDVITDLCAIVGEVSLLDFGSDDKR